MKEGEDPSDFVVTFDSKKIPNPTAVAKAVPSDYEYKSMSFNAVAGEVTSKEGKLRFVPAGSDKEYLLGKGEIEDAGGMGAPKTHPFDDLVSHAKEAPRKVALTGAVTEAKKDEKTVLSVGVTEFKKIEEKK